MFHLITGGSGSGKSEYAEQKLMEYASHSKRNKKRYYIATMIPFGKETEEKIRTAEAEYDKRLATLIANMEKTLAKIENREAAGSLESAAAESADDDPVRETEVKTGEEDTSETDAGSDVVWWDFSEFPGNLAFLINWMKF